MEDINITDETQDSSRERHAIFLVNTKDVGIDGFKGTQTIKDGKLATIVLKDSKNVFVRGSQPIPGNGSFLRLEGKDLGPVSVIGNDLSGAKRVFEFETKRQKDLLFQTANRLPRE